MPDFDSFVAQLNQIRDEMAKASGAMPSAELMGRIQGLMTQIKSKAEEAKAGLKDKAMATAADLKAKAAAIREAKKPKPTSPEAVPHPWEDHQGLDAKQLQHMIDSLMQLAKTPASGVRH